VSSGRPAVFLDRDGVIAGLVWLEDDNAYESASSPDRVELMPDAAHALKAIGAAGYLTVVASNQPAAAKRTATHADLAAAHERFVELLEGEGVRLDDYRYCFHHPEGTEPELTATCSCRKPEPRLILDAAAELGVDVARIWMIGDADRDVEAGSRAGCRTVLIENPLSAHRRNSAGASHYRARNLDEAGVIVTRAEL
jgi:D-glycero-D-manno-heptose 1,7-bisphosphate phosphatase